jgi:hypothetical protein
MHELVWINSNCIGYAYHELGIIPEEKICDCPTLPELLDKFDSVSVDCSADAIAIVASIDGELAVTHMAVFNVDKNKIKHRRGCGLPITESKLLENELEDYLKDYDNSVLVYLKLKHE